MGTHAQQQYDVTLPWNVEVKGNEVLPLINEDAPIIL